MKEGELMGSGGEGGGLQKLDIETYLFPNIYKALALYLASHSLEDLAIKTDPGIAIEPSFLGSFQVQESK